MTRTALILAALAAALLPAAAQAQSRVFVAAHGSDGNPCTFALPCRTFQHAHDTAEEDGEIDVLDPAGYGGLTITKSLSIQGHGFAGISVTGFNNGITVNAPASAAINISGLLIDGNHAGGSGIVFNSGFSLVVTSCVIRNMGAHGIQFASSATVLQTLSVSNSTITDNVLSGILINNLGSGPITAAVDRSRLFRNFIGLNVIGTGGTGNIDVSATNTTAGNQTGTGFVVQSTAGHSPTVLVMMRSSASNSPIGVQASGANATLRLANSALAGNDTAFAAVNSGTILTYRDNSFVNFRTTTGTLGTASRQ